MTKLTRIAVLVIAAMLAVGCVPTWTRVDKPLARDPGKTFQVDLPKGWMRAQIFRDRLVVTRDGLGLNAIEVRRIDHKNAFSRIKKSSRADMLPSELAELELADTKKEDPITATAEVVNNRPATIAGHAGYRLALRFRNQDGLRIERVIYGFADKRGYFTLSYQAPQLYYFPRDLQTFEQVVASMTLSGK